MQSGDLRGKNQQTSSPCLRVTVVKATVAMAAPTATVVSRIASSRDTIATPFGDRVLEYNGALRLQNTSSYTL